MTSAFLRNLLLSAVDAVIAADMKGKILLFNDAASEICGYSKQEALNSLDIRDLYPGGTAKQVMRMMRSEEYGGKGKLKSYCVNIMRKDAEIVPIRLNASIIYDGDKEVATIGFFRDQRDTLKMQSELENTQLQLLQAEKMASLGKLAAGVAHQLNNPLSGISLFAKLVLEEYDLVEEARKDLQRVLRDVKRCRDIVKELLEFARQTRQEIRPIDINRSVSRTLFLLENQALFQNIKIKTNLDASLPPVPGDSQQLNHAFMNIILNAAEAMEGKGTLVIKSYKNSLGDHVCIEIFDTGPGIPDDVLPHIFEPFFTTKEQGKGTGLGLSLVYGILQDHQGSIKIRSTPGNGATFIIELPLRRDEKSDEGKKRTRPHADTRSR
ncbi:MAG TPA: ATP-binding protein [Spirochaetia bacterium]|nr:ATP-binding protein [Spirochaetia bacterium]